MQEGAVFSQYEVPRLLIHEIGIHVARAENATCLGLDFLALSYGRYLLCEEGLATYSEAAYQVLDERTSRQYALRALAASIAIDGSFSEIVMSLSSYTDTATAVQLALRAKRGLTDTAAPGGYIKDHVYLQGRLAVERLAITHPSSPHLLLSGKVAIEDFPLLQSMAAEGLIRTLALTPEDVLVVADDMFRELGSEDNVTCS